MLPPLLTVLLINLAVIAHHQATGSMAAGWLAVLAGLLTIVLHAWLGLL